MKPRLLDLFCGAGGSAVGYARAGFEVVGADHVAQPNYPFEFWQNDAPEVLERLLDPSGHYQKWVLDDFGAIHASPPCQAFTAYRRKGRGVGDGYADMIAETRELLEATGLPWVIENVEGAPLDDPLLLCGSMFDLDVQRHRLFEFGQPYEHPLWGCRHKIWAPRFPAATNRGTNSRRTVEIGVWRIPLETQKQAMGVDWGVTLEELSEMVPPAYTELVGHQLMQHLEARRAA